MNAARGGFALLAVILIVTALTAGLLLQAQRAAADRRQAANAVALVHARMAARAGVEHALVRLAAAHKGADSDLRWVERSLDGLEHVPLGSEAKYSVSASDDASRLPLNHATAEELQRLLLGIGTRSAVAASIAADIVASRDCHYPASPGCTHSAGDWGGMFLAVEDLARIPGVERRLVAALARYVTTTGRGTVNVNTAHEPVLRALPGMTEEAVRLVVSRRTQGAPVRNVLELQAGLSARAREALEHQLGAFLRRASFEPGTIEIVSIGRASVNHGIAARVDAAVILSAGRARAAHRIERW